MRFKNWMKAMACGLVCVGPASAQIRLGAPATTEGEITTPVAPPPRLVDRADYNQVVSSPAPSNTVILSSRDVAAQQQATTTLSNSTSSNCGASTGPVGGDVWFQPQATFWRPTGMRIPALATSSPLNTPAGLAGVLDQPTTSVVLGNRSMVDDSRFGFELRGGYWFDSANTIGIDVGGFYLGRGTESATVKSSGSPGLFQPFFDANTGLKSAQPIAAINVPVGVVTTGSVTVDAGTELSGFDINYRHCLCDSGDLRRDLLVGYRYFRLQDTLGIRSDSTAIVSNAANSPPFGSTISRFDRFQTVNSFNGFQLGATFDRRIGALSVGGHFKLGLGEVEEQTNIQGNTATRALNGAISGAPGGLYAQASNIGSHARTDFAVLPELGVNAGLELGGGFRVFVGYRLLYLSRVARAGDQVDGALNGGHPAYIGRTTELWVHGANAGLEVRY